jgi:hypothetical protein
MPWRMSSVPTNAFLSRIAHTTPAQADRPPGFRSPNFPKGVGKSRLQKIGSPAKVAGNPISLALVVPRLCANNMRERHSPRLSALRRGAVVEGETSQNQA